MSAVRTPLFFGDEERSLFGWYHPASPRGEVAAIICPPVGHEYINSHRSLRHLAEKLAERGIPTLRFDYHGVGNSAGRDEDPERAAAWHDSIRQALTTLRRLSSCRRVVLIGVRLGAILAAGVAQEIEVDGLVLWFPSVRGKTFVRELKAMHLTAAKQDSSEEGHIEAGGFVMTPETQRQLSALDIEAAIPRTQRVMVIARDDMNEDVRLRDRWQAAGINVEQRVSPGYTDMFAAPHMTRVPHEAIDAIVSWVSRDAEKTSVPSGEVAWPIRGEQNTAGAESGMGVHERVVSFGSGQEMFGILTEPAEGFPAGGPLILLPNAGSVHHVGPSRLYVLIARSLARAGLRSLRFDLLGLGDSASGEMPNENDPYPDAISEIVGDAIAAMTRAESAQSFILMGLCSGAHAAFRAALDLDDARIVESVLINPLTFYYKRGMSLEGPTNHYEEWQRYLRSVRSLDRWKKLLRPDVKIANVIRSVVTSVRVIISKKIAVLKRLLSGQSPPQNLIAADDLARDLRRLVDRGRRATFIFSRFDPGHDLLMLGAGRDVPRLQKQGRVSITRIDGANHTFESKRSRERMIDGLTQDLRQRYVR